MNWIATRLAPEFNGIGAKGTGHFNRLVLMPTNV